MNAVDIAARGLAQRALQSDRSLASPLGAAQVGAADGRTVQDAIGFATVAELLGSAAPSRGGGALWRAGGFYYTEAPADAADHHLQTAAGVKLYVEPQVPMRGFHAGAFGARTLEPDEFGDTLAEAANAAANNAAIQAALDAAAARNWEVLFDAGTYCYSAEFTCDKPIGILGRGWSATVFQPASDYSGWFMGFTEVHYNDADAAADYTQDRSALRLRDFSVQCRDGRSATEQQHGIRFIGRCDRMIIGSVFFSYLAGTALHFGHMNGDPDTVAYARECMISNVEARWCGDDTAQRPVFVFDNYGTVPAQDGCNLCVCDRLWAIFPYFTGLHIVNNNPSGAQVRRMAFNNVLVHGVAAMEPVQVTTAPLIHIEGKALLCVFRDLWFNSHYAGQYGVQVDANASGTPALISFEGGNISTGDGHGFNFQAGYGFTVDFQLWGQAGTGITVGPGVGPVSVGQASGQVPSLSIAPGMEKMVNCVWASTASLPVRSEKFVLGPNANAPSINYFGGNPSANVTANAGSLSLNTAGLGQLNSSTLAVKVSGAGATGWAYLQEVIGGTTAQRPASPTAN
ncbi:MAG: hypothetical protein J2O44_00005, partial [Porphyrobacter sp.]|nr:hypothetical protein [Porphyrobacter sp.]